jgi:hypothetical protein
MYKIEHIERITNDNIIYTYPDCVYVSDISSYLNNEQIKILNDVGRIAVGKYLYTIIL